MVSIRNMNQCMYLGNNMKQIILNNFKQLQDMTVEEYTLYRKWNEINSIDWKITKERYIKEVGR